MSCSPTGDRRRSAPSFFNRLGFFKRRPKSDQIDYRNRWPTVTTLVEQRSDSGFFSNKETKPLNKPTKVKALETASVPLRWLHHRLESVQDHLDHSIEVAEAKALKRASLPEKPTRPGESTHPYDTGVETHTRENAIKDGREDESTGTVLKFETNITAKASSPPSSLNKWRLPFTGAAKAGQGRQVQTGSPRPSSGHSTTGPDEEDITAGAVHPSQWKSAKNRRPSKFPERKASIFSVSTTGRRKSSNSGKRAGTSHATESPKPSPEPSQHHKKHLQSPRRESATSSGRPTSSSRVASPRTITPSQSTDPAAAAATASQQTARRISGQFAQAVGLLSPQSRSRTTSANRGMEHAQQQKRGGGRKTSATSRTPAGSNSATPQEQHEDPMGAAAAAVPAASASPLDVSPSSFKSPKSGAFRHLLNVVKGGVPPSRAMSPLSMNGD
ncbi:hypothetical protein PG993_004062 [Apiospora rasikravindrae]|uniref:Uncharacterized protein n=1 Tax=Apiospora rasikravindrae TaxID=990691 RepID=A0ABR1TBQ0_9PEZI